MRRRISAPQEVLEVSVKDDDEKLLEGLSAADEEDGDLSDSIFIESMSEFDNDNCRTVTMLSLTVTITSAARRAASATATTALRASR